MVQADDFLSSLGIRDDPYNVPEIKKIMSEKPQPPPNIYSPGLASTIEFFFQTSRRNMHHDFVGVVYRRYFGHPSSIEGISAYLAKPVLLGI
jgi:hypothetical protein